MKAQNGFSLVELMVASFIGVVLLAGVTNLLITTNKSVSLSDGVAQNQETGRFAMDYLSTFIRKAGYNSYITESIPPLLINSGKFACPALGLPCAANNPGTRGDRLSMPFTIIEGETMRSCAGTDLIAAGVESRSFSTVFWVNDVVDSVNERDLQCGTYDIDNAIWIDNNISILSNVEAFEFLVGLAESEESKNAARYVTVDQAVGNNNLIRSIRIAILTTSQDQANQAKIQSKLASRKYALLDNFYEPNNDGQIRNIFSNTIELPNAIEAAR